MKMSVRIVSICLFVICFTFLVSAQTTEFTYQGSLKNSGVAANGNYDFEFALFDALAAGTQIGSTLTRSTVAVADGNFSVKLDFGSQFPGANRFLEIRVRPTGQPGITTLEPRQLVNSQPYGVRSITAATADLATNATNAVNAASATNATNAVNATNATTAATATNALSLGGVAANQYVLTGDARLSDARAPTAGSANYIQNQNAAPQAASSFNISGNGVIAGNVGIGTGAPAARLDIRHEGGDTLMITQAGVAAFPKVVGRNSGGTLAAPTATTTNRPLLSLIGRGHTGTGFSSDRAWIDLVAAEDWTNSANGTRIVFATTSNGTTGAFERMRIDDSGNVGVATSAPANRLHVVESLNGDGGVPANHVVQIQNTSAGTSADVLALKIARADSPGSSNNFITFFKGDDSTVGSIEGNGSGGVVLAGAGADYAEWLPLADTTEKIRPGDLVGIFNGRISKTTNGAAQVMVASTGAIVAGNDPGANNRDTHTLIAFIGQASVRVIGAVKLGDLIVPSGLEDGTGRAVSPDSITPEEFSRAVGQAWEASSETGVKQVRVAVGLMRNDPTAARLLEQVRSQQRQINELRQLVCLANKQAEICKEQIK